MGRKNRKGRTKSQNPRRYYHPKKSGTSARRQPADPLIAGHSWNGAVRDPGADPLGLVPTPTDEARALSRPRALTATVSALTCGRCVEWTPNGDGASVHLLGELGRGNCLHPASGFSFPATDTPACPYFH